MTRSDTRKKLVLALVCIAQFMVTLDLAIVNVALPSMQRELGLRESSLQWIVIAYGLLFGGFLLLGGRLGDLLGRRSIFFAGLALFTVASLVAGVAQSAAVLIGARAVEGFGAALLVPTSLAVLAVTFHEGRERNLALGLVGAISAASGSVGIVAGGLLTDGPGWRWIFFINVPIGLALLAAAARFLPSDQPRSGKERRQFDLAGATTVTGGLLLLIYGLNRGAEYGWGAATTLALFAASVLCFAAFVWVESHSRAPLVPAVVLRNRTMVASDLAAFFSFGAFLSFIFLGTLLMQQLLGYSALQTGTAWLATSLTGFVAAALTGSRLVGALGVRRLLITSMSLTALGIAWLIRLPTNASYVTDLLPGLLLVGMGVGLSAPGIQIGALTGAVGETAGLASGLVGMMREIGGAVGVAAVSTILVSQIGNASTGRGPGVDRAALLSGFHDAFLVIVILTSLGAVIASFAFPRTTVRPEPQPVAEAKLPEVASPAD